MRRRSRARFVIVCGLLGAFSFADGSSADDALDLQFYRRQAERALHARPPDDHTALRALLEVRRLAPSRNAEYNVGFVAHRAGEDVLAWQALTTYVAADPAAGTFLSDATRRVAELERRLTIVAIWTEPPGAAVYVGGREYGSVGTTPTRFALRQGRHRLLISMDRHDVAEIMVDATAGVRVNRSVSLRPHTGTLVIEDLPADCTLECERDDGTRHSLSGTSTHQLLVGTYRCLLAHPAMLSAEHSVSILAGVTSTLRLSARPRDMPTGRIVVRATPSARLLLDGVPIAETPIVLRDVATGAHRIELQAPGYRTWFREFEVEADRATRIDARLRPAIASRP